GHRRYGVREFVGCNDPCINPATFRIEIRSVDDAVVVLNLFLAARRQVADDDPLWKTAANVEHLLSPSVERDTSERSEIAATPQVGVRKRGDLRRARVDNFEAGTFTHRDVPAQWVGAHDFVDPPTRAGVEHEIRSNLIAPQFSVGAESKHLQ